MANRLQETMQRLILGTTKKELENRRWREGYEDGYNDGGEDEPVSGTMRRYGYSAQKSAQGRNFDLAGYKEILRIAWQYYQSSPLAKRLLTLKRDYIMGDELKPRSTNEQANEIISQFWKDNKMGVVRSKEFVLQLFLLGSQIYPAFVRGADGKVSLGYIDPEQIEQVITHPDNSMEQIAVVVKETQSTLAWETPQGKKAYRIIRKDVDIIGPDENIIKSKFPAKLVTAEQANIEDWELKMLESFGQKAYSGSCFYTKVNSVSNHPYGYSDLAQSLDWIDQLDAVLFALADRERMADYFSFDVAVEGNRDQVDIRAKEIDKHPPKKGSVNIHTKDEEWTLHAPMLHQSQSVETVNAILTFILGGMGYPRHWYGHGDYTNRATAESQADPSWRSLEHDQGIVKDMFLDICQFVIDQAIIAGGSGISEKEPIEIIMDMPEMSIKDISSIAGIFHNILFAMGEATQNRWVTSETVMKVIAKIMEEMGIPFDIEKELEGIKLEPPPQPIVSPSPIASKPFNPGGNPEETKKEWENRLKDIDLRFERAKKVPIDG